MLRIKDVRRVALATAVAAAALVSAGPAAAAKPSIDLPCVKGLTCPAPSPAPAHHGCADADLVPAADNLGKVERATVCLLNKQRIRHGLHKLHVNPSLGEVAVSYARKMVSQNFFDHVSPAGSTFDQRIRSVGYLKGVRGWSLGENLAWGGGSLSTPRAIVSAWMHSPGHRQNILDSHFRETGLGVAVGTPVGHVPGATYANEFGTRVR